MIDKIFDTMLHGCCWAIVILDIVRLVLWKIR